MARISRKERIRAMRAGENTTAPVPAPAVPKVWDAAVYARLSIRETRDRLDGEALSNQVSLLTSYLQRQPGLRLQQVYIDHGETGTNFDRAGFQRMMGDVQAGRINCIVVKDLSRFGRDHIEAGNYLEQVLPFLGVRFISVNDGYDSADASCGDLWKVALRNLINQMYSQDISRKSGAVLRDKQRQGEFIGSFAAYGYLRNPADPRRLTIDVETAPIVQALFHRRSQGMRFADLARWLDRENIPTPGVYRYLKGVTIDARFQRGEKSWRPQTIGSILSNPVYLGHTVQGKSRSAFYAGCPKRRLSPTEWVVVRDTHPPLVTQAVFDQVQSLCRAASREGTLR